MKQILKTIAILFCLQSISYASKSQTVFSQLAEINTYWHQFNPDIEGLQTQFVFASEQQKIQTHLLYVEKYLRSLPTYLLTMIQIKNRNHCLDILLKYANQGLFPKNTHHPGQRIPYFIDDAKTPCAVGHIIIQTGFGAVAQIINKENNYGYLKDLVQQYPEIFDWAKENGFSVDELAWIQPCYGGNGGGNIGYGGTFPFLLSDSSIIRNPSCAGKVDGFISIDSNLFATSPKPLVATISFINNYGSVGTSVSLSKDVYTITVTDAVNASTVSIFTLTDTAIVLLPTLSNTFNICNSFDTNASITITNVSGGVGPYTYGIVPIDMCSFMPNLFDSIVFQNGNSFTGLENLNYHVYVKDINGCKATQQVNLMDTSALAYYNIITPNNCINVNATVVTKIINMIPSFTTYDTFFLAAGNHVITSSTGCVQNILVPSKYWNANATSNTTIACNGGTSNVTVGHSIVFNVSAFFGTFTGEGTFASTAGVKQFIVTDSLGCIDTATIVITEPDVLTNSVSAFPLQCFGDSTLIGYNTNGGTPPYNYNYNFGSTLLAGNYTIQTTDANGCTFTNTILITQPSAINNQIFYTPVLCNGGMAVINNITSGGTSPYTYDYPNGTSFVAGIYTIETTDANGCKKNNLVTVVEPTIATSQIMFDPITCYGESTIISYITAGATPPYTYNYPNGSLLNAGNHSVIITDSNGCNFADTIIIAQPDSISVQNLITTQVGGGFSVNFTTQGGTGAYTYVFQKEVSAGSYSTVGVTGSLPYLLQLPGTYRVKITDANGCISYIYFTVNFPAFIGKNNTNTITISPNPFTNTIVVNGLGQKNIGEKIIVTDIQGKIIASQIITNSEIKMHLGNIASGMYALKIGDEIIALRKD